MKEIFENYVPGKRNAIQHPLRRTLVRLALCAAITAFITSCQSKSQPEMKEAEEVHEYYTCSMHPQVMSPNPGKCPICGMTLIKVSKTMEEGSNEIILSDQQMLLGNIKVDSIATASIGDKIYLTGTLNFNLYKSTSVSARVMGRIEKLYFKNVGDYVQRGEKLFDIYSEDLNNAKQEYILALQQKKNLDSSLIDYSRLIQSAKNKLLLWGLTEKQIEELNTTEQSSPLTSFYSSVSGYITSMNVKEGDYTMEGGTIFTLADLSTLWAEAQVYTAQLSALDKSGIATVQIPDMSGKEFKGNIQYVNPEINPDTRIDLIRVEIPNTDHRLKPGMPAYVIINSTQHKSFTLPIDAVLRDSKGAAVWVRTNHNTFASRMVETGLETDDRIEILSGLKPGDIVVTRGAYLLNSEYKFKKGSNTMAGMKM